MAITVDADWVWNNGSSASLIRSINSVTAGSNMVAIVSWYSTNTISSVAVDNGNGNMTLAGSQTGGPGNGRLAIYYLENVTTGGNLSVTCTFSGANSAGMAVASFDGGDTSDWFDGPVYGDSGGAGSRDVDVTTGKDNNMIVAALINSGSNSASPSGYTVIWSTAHFWYDDADYDLDVGTAGTYDVDFGSSGGTWCILAASFNVASAAAAVPGIEVHRFFPGASF